MRGWGLIPAYENPREGMVSQVSYFYVYKDTADQWRWRFTAKNGKTIAVSSESYHNLSDCENGIGLVREQSASSPVVGDSNYNKLRN